MTDEEREKMLETHARHASMAVQALKDMYAKHDAEAAKVIEQRGDWSVMLRNQSCIYAEWCNFIVIEVTIGSEGVMFGKGRGVVPGWVWWVMAGAISVTLSKAEEDTLRGCSVEG
jgi:hypothetical protein